MKTIFRTFMLSSLLLLTGCATIISGSRQTVRITSDPASATVYINEIEVGKTPVEKDLKRNQEYQLTLKLDGYKPYNTKLEKKFNAWYIGNVVFGGVIGLIVDPITGAMYKLRPEQINGSLQNGIKLKTESGDVFITVSMEVEPGLAKVGQLEKAK